MRSGEAEGTHFRGPDSLTPAQDRLKAAVQNNIFKNPFNLRKLVSFLAQRMQTNILNVICPNIMEIHIIAF